MEFHILLQHWADTHEHGKACATGSGRDWGDPWSKYVIGLLKTLQYQQERL